MHLDNLLRCLHSGADIALSAQIAGELLKRAPCNALLRQHAKQMRPVRSLQDLCRQRIRRSLMLGQLPASAAYAHLSRSQLAFVCFGQDPSILQTMAIRRWGQPLSSSG